MTQKVTTYGLSVIAILVGSVMTLAGIGSLVQGFLLASRIVTLPLSSVGATSGDGTARVVGSSSGSVTVVVTDLEPTTAALLTTGDVLLFSSLVLAAVSVAIYAHRTRNAPSNLSEALRLTVRIGISAVVAAIAHAVTGLGEVRTIQEIDSPTFTLDAVSAGLFFDIEPTLILVGAVVVATFLERSRRAENDLKGLV